MRINWRVYEGTGIRGSSIEWHRRGCLTGRGTAGMAVAWGGVIVGRLGGGWHSLHRMSRGRVEVVGV